MPKNSIKIASLTKPTGAVIPSFYKDREESEYYDAYLANLQIADLLEAQFLYQDAWSHLNIAVECFFKYVFCIIRQKIESGAPSNHNLVDLNVSNLFLYGTVAFSRKNHPLLCKEFKHDVSNLWKMIDGLTDASLTSIDFKNLINSIPSQEEWVSARYKGRNHPLYQAKYIPYYADFKSCLGSIFGAIK